MSVWVDRNTRVVVQGMGRDGSFHAKSMKAYGTKVVAGVSPTKAGEKVDGIPLFATLAEAVKKTRANTSIIYVPAAGAADAMYEAIDSGVDLVVAITEGVPVRDMIGVWDHLKRVQKARKDGGPRLIGPNCPGLISPGLCKVGIMPGHIHKKGDVGLVSRSGTLTYEVVHLLTHAGMGQTTCIGIGGDPINGTNFIDALAAFERDKDTKGIVLIGEIGGTDEDEAARFIQQHVKKPVVAFIAGQTAPPGKRMGHAGAIIQGGAGTAADKMKAFAKVGVPVARIPSEIPGLLAKAMGRKLRGEEDQVMEKKRGTTAKAAGWSPAAEKTPKSQRKKTGIAAKRAERRTAASKTQGGLDRSRAKLAKQSRKTRPAGKRSGR